MSYSEIIQSANTVINVPWLPKFILFFYFFFTLGEENEQSTDSQTSRNLRSKKNLVAEKNKSEEKE